MTEAAEPPLERGPARPAASRRRVLVRATAVGAVVLSAAYVVLTWASVWWAARADPYPDTTAEAIVVLGAAQFNGRPSPVLRTRLDHTLDLYEAGLAPIIVVTGGRQPGDAFTEASASANYLLDRGVPDADIRREVQGTSSWESLAASARFLAAEGVDDVILVSDPFHAARLYGIAEEVGLDATVAPVPNSRFSGGAELRAMGRETVAVGLGRLVGYRRLTNWLE